MHAHLGFNYLIPALIINLKIAIEPTIGPLPIGYSLYNGIVGSGSIQSVPGYNTTLNATIVHMDDFFELYADNTYFTVNPRGLILTDDNQYIKVAASGLVQDTQRINDIIAQKPGTIATGYGEQYSAASWRFSAAGEKYKDLTNSLFVGNIRMFPTDGKSVYEVEFRLSKVLSGPPKQYE